MFEKFGEFDSFEEINRAAAAQYKEGDLEAIKELAIENGLEAEDAKDLIGGIVDELCNVSMAALGKLKVEAAALDLPFEFTQWVDMLREKCFINETLARGVRKKGKKLTVVLGQLLKASSENCKKVPEEIARAAGVQNPCYIGTVDRQQFDKIVMKYYTEGRHDSF